MQLFEKKICLSDFLIITLFILNVWLIYQNNDEGAYWYKGRETSQFFKKYLGHFLNVAYRLPFCPN